MYLHSKGRTRSVVALLLLIFSTTLSAANLQVAGLAVYTDTARDIYIAGLLTSSGSAPGSLAEVSAPAAMEYRIATRRISDRGLSGTILLQAEVGSGKRAPTEVVDGLAQLKQRLGGALRNGDQFQVALSEGGDTVFRLNDVELLSLPGSSVFEYLLNGWIGDSASALMRDSLLAGKLDGDVMQRYEALIPLDERKELVASWGGAAAATKAVAPAPKPAPTPAPKPVPAPKVVEPKPEPEPEPEQVAQVEAPAPEPEPENVASPDEPAPEEDAAAIVAAVISGGVVEEAVEEPAEALEVAAAEPDPEQAWLDTLDDREYQQQLNDYIASVMIKVFRSVRYPKRAVKREWEGQVEVLAEVGAKGDIRKISLEASSGRDILDEEALEAVKRAAPFPELTPVAKAEFLADNGSNSYFMMIPVKFMLN